MSDHQTIRALPDGATIEAVVAFASASSPKFLMDHNYRTFLFGCMLIDAGSNDFDAEAALVASMLHDIGLVDTHIGTTSFELVGADVAAKFLETQNWFSERIRLVEHAIIRHIDLTALDSAELRVVQAGAAFDVAGFPPEAVNHPTTRHILAAYPRASMATNIRTAILAEIHRQPDGAFARLESQVGLSELVLHNPLDSNKQHVGHDHA